MRDQVAQVIDKLRPVIQADGGDLELLSVSDDGIVTLRVRGSCTGCGSAALTLRNGIERWIRTKVPGVQGVVASE
ncbi:MAG: NifU family protein [Candidatus Eisenbacteria bacterium]|uniref:NifU family protein n=1 Tax=Eiseniibacteriota bacterium TaxID=2212470 RepID=A0A538U495_UNCEI|nr:MAG: NifU family protein [Candidatus Eisenbacteria bacterium]